MLRSLCVALALLFAASEAAAIPAFARKYRVSCNLCHAPVPRLTPFGEQFAGNGFAFAANEPPRDTIATGDPLLQLPRDVPLAVRIDSYLTALTKRVRGESATDQQTPWVVKLLSGGQLAERISYYMYFLLGERGEVAGLEDAYIQFTDVGNSGVSVVAGQFQVSDPLFKRELRLQYEDYQPYRVRVGDTRVDLTYDRGLMALWSPREGTDVALMAVNGRGLDAATAARQYDGDSFKNVGARLSQDVGPARVGAFGYYGEESADGAKSRIRVLGPDATFPLSSVGEINLQYLRRWDDDPFLGAQPAPRGSTVDAAMAELLIWPGGQAGRWFVAGLFNWIEADREVVSLRLGEQQDSPPFLRHYRTSSLGVHYLLRRNARMTGEAMWDVDHRRARLVGGLMVAF
jgi:hypothetical protein